MWRARRVRIRGRQKTVGKAERSCTDTIDSATLSFCTNVKLLFVMSSLCLRYKINVVVTAL